MEIEPTFNAIMDAQRRTANLVVQTPLIESAELNRRIGRRVLIKLETMQRTGAFKFRGASARLTALSPQERKAGVVAYSTGNHGMAVAEAARLLGLSATVVAPLDTPTIKLDRIRASGASVQSCDRFTENGEEIGRALAAERGAVFVHPFDDPGVIAGQGTLAVEMIEQARALGADMNALLVNSAGGGFVSGCAIATRELAPDCAVYSVECDAWNAIARSMASGKHEHNLEAAPSICDAIQARAPGKAGYAVFSRLLSGAITVSDEAAVGALRFAFEHLRTVVEPGGAVGLAAVLDGQVVDNAQTIGIVLCGANVDPGLYAQWIMEASK